MMRQASRRERATSFPPGFRAHYGPSESVTKHRTGEFGADRPTEKSGDRSQDGRAWLPKKEKGFGSRSDGTADLLESLKTVLENACPEADLFVLGLDSNVAGDESAAFQVRLRKLGLHQLLPPRIDT